MRKLLFPWLSGSALLAGVVNLSMDGRVFSDLGAWWRVSLYCIGIAFLVSAVLCAVAVVRPRLRADKTDLEWESNFIFFGHLRKWNAPDLTDKLYDSDPLPMLSRQLIAMSRIAWTKHCFVQWSMNLTVAGTAILFLCGLLIAY